MTRCGADWRHLFGGPRRASRALADDYDDVAFTPPSLARITADTLIVFGDRDPLCPVSLAFDLHAAIPHSYLRVVPRGGWRAA
jgi:pimeloyl-ACP methyl ester carboxylesterase